MQIENADLIQKKEKTEKTLLNVIVLPVIPKVMFEAIKLLDNQFTTAFELNKIITKDQALVTKIITIANSPLYGLQRKVTTVDYAILVLGYKELKNIISALSVAEAFRNKTDRYLNQKEFFLHSYLAGTASKKLSNDIGFNNSGEAFIAGFLHDVGISIIHRYMHSSFIAICDLVEKQKMSFHDAELEILGLTHEQVGSFLLEKWNFPQEISNTILYHHAPSDTNTNPILSAIVHMADCLTQQLKFGDFTWDKNISPNPFAMKKFNLERELDFEKFSTNYKDLFWEQVEFVRFLT